jgi:hypothetical protein
MSQGIVARVAFFTLSMCCVSAAALAAEEKPEEQLKAKGLKRTGATLILADEQEVLKLSRELSQLKRSLFAAKRDVTAAEKKAQAVEQQANLLRRQRAELRRRLAAARSVRENNQIVTMMEELDEQIPKLEEQGLRGKTMKDAQAEEAKAREAYIEAVMKVRKLHDETAESYGALKEDQEVKGVIDAMNATTDNKVSLGPSTAFARLDASLKRIEETVLSEKINVRIDENDLVYVEAVFCGKHVMEVNVATSASAVMLPYEVAEKIGIPPSAGDPTVELVMVDGRTIEATEKVIPKLRVGKFEVEKVACYVLPASARESEPTLGQSFLNQFTYKLDPAAKTLVMTRVE